MHAGTESLIRRLEEARVPHELLAHRRTLSAEAEARALGVDPHEVAKTVVLTTPAGFVRAVLPASERVDLDKVRTVLEEEDVRIASEDLLVGAYPEFELGAVPPLGGSAGDRVLVDRRLCEAESVVLEAGTHEQSLRLRTEDLLAVADARLADIAAR